MPISAARCASGPGTPRAAEPLHSDDPGFKALQNYFLDRLIPACASLLDAAVKTGEMSGDIDALTLTSATGSLCIGVEAGGTAGYDAHRTQGCNSSRRPDKSVRSSTAGT